MQDCAAAALDLVFPAGQPSQEAAYPLLHRRSASQAQVPGRLFPRPSPNGFICVEVWAVARQIHQPQPQARPAQILPHRLATMGWGIIPDYLKRPKVPLAQLVQKGCRGSAVAVSLQFPPVPSIPPLPSPDTPPNSSWLSRHTADCWSSPGLALPAAPTGPATPHRHGSGPRRRRISWLRSLLPPLAFFCVFHLGFGLARCGPSRRGAGRAFAVGPVERVAADLAAVGRRWRLFPSPTAARPQPVLADLQHPSPADVPVARRQAGAGGPASQRQRFAATIDRIGVKDGWRSAITVLLKDVELADTGDRRHSSRKELLGAMARQRLTGESAPSQTVEQEARFAGVTKRRYQQVLQATREDLGLAPPNSGGRPPAAAVQEDAEALTWSGCWSFRRIPSRPWCGPPAPRLPGGPGDAAWASGTGGPPCFGSVAGVKPGRAPGLPAPPGS